MAAPIRRAAGIKGEIDHFGAGNFLAGLLIILRDSGFSGLLLVLDEVETLQRMRADTLLQRVNDDYIAALAQAVTGNLGGRVGVAPRVFLKKLVGDVLDRVDRYPDFDPRAHYALTIADTELSAQERAGRGASGVDDIEL